MVAEGGPLVTDLTLWYDRWAFECSDVFSQQVMLAAPNAMGQVSEPC